MVTNCKRLADAARTLGKKNGHVVLATIVETLGSTYQKAGARMMIAEDGEFSGLLGGGCFEGDLREQAQPVFADGRPRTVFYDMRSPDDAIWGLGLGCNGAVRIFLQRLSREEHFCPLHDMTEVTAADQIAVLATVLESSHADYAAGMTVLLPAASKGDALQIQSDHPLFAVPAGRVLVQGQPQIMEHAADGKAVKVFYDPVKPPPKLLVLGAGPDAVPVTRFARQLDWQVTVIDHRPAYVRPERFPDVDAILNITPEALHEKIDLDQFDALVLMTHSIEYDERYLREIAPSHIPYIGLLGPAKRRDRLLDSLGEQAVNIRGRAFGPVGLDIGAQTPEEIALSIMAEIQAVRRQRDGHSLHQVDLPLQERATPN